VPICPTLNDFISTEEREAIVDRIAANPECGVVIPGTGGIRKVRFGFGGRGKRGGARIIYFLQGDDLHARGVCQERESGLDAEGASRPRYFDQRNDCRLSGAPMTKRTFDKIKAGLDDARAYLDGTADKRRYRIHVPETMDVKKIRMRLGLSQEAFAETYGFALSAVRDWEQGRRRPERSARILLKIVEKEPDAVTRALAR
jgi:putative transcriptional regulator